MAVDVGEIRARLVAQDDMSAGILGANQSILGMAAAFGGAQVAVSLAANALELFVGTLKESVMLAANVGAELDDLEKISGMTAAQLSEMRYVTQVLGEDLGRLSNVSFMMARRMNEDGEAFERALRAMGISFNEFFLLSPQERLLAVSDALRGTASYAKQVEIAFGLMGREGRNQLPILLEDLRALTEESHRLGVQWTEENIKAADEFDKNLNRLKLTVEGLKISIGNQLIPALNELGNTFRDEGLLAALGTLTAAMAVSGGTPMGIVGALNRASAARSKRGDVDLDQAEAAAAQTTLAYIDATIARQREMEKSVAKIVDGTERMHAATRALALEWERTARAAAQHAAEVRNGLIWTIQQQYAQMGEERYGVDQYGVGLEPGERGRAIRQVESPFKQKIAELQTQRAMLPEADTTSRQKIDEMIEWEQLKMRDAVQAILDMFAGLGAAANTATDSLSRLSQTINPSAPMTTPRTGSNYLSGLSAPSLVGTIPSGKFSFGAGFSPARSSLEHSPSLERGPGVNVVQNFPISSDPRAQTELQRLIEEAIAQAMRGQGVPTW